MKKGKHTCKVLKEIRRQIAEANDIEFITSECRYQGDCAGTCPKCEAEVQQLEQQLAHKRLTGKSIAVLGISSGLIAMTSPLVSCNHSANKTQGEAISDTTERQATEYALEGIAPYDSTTQRAFDDPMGIPEGKISDKTEGLPMPMPILDDVFDLVGEISGSPAEYPGGTKALAAFMKEHFRHPSIEASVQGKCIVQLNIQADGSIKDARITHSVHPLYDEEVLRVVGIMPKWNPGTRGGEAVKTSYTLPLKFGLE